MDNNYKEMKPEQFTLVGSRPEFTPDTIGTHSLLKSILEAESGCLSRLYYEGYSNYTEEQLHKIVSDLDGSKFYEYLYVNDRSIMYRWDSAFLQLHFSKNNHLMIEFISKNDKITEAIKNIFEKSFTAPTKQGYVFAIMKGVTGALQLTRIGHAGIKLERENYSAEVIKDYDYLIKDFKTKSPSGRIGLLNGAPGTGKTYLIRGLLMDVPDAMFVIVPPAMVASIGGPELLPMLLKHKEDHRKKGPTILVLEDADHCLAPRQSDNMSSISSILNLGDGIFGSLFDIRILATTNAKKVELDSAVIRAGRLSKQIEVGPMKYDEANKVYQRLISKALDVSKEELSNKESLPKETKQEGMRPLQKVEYSLAEVYKHARDAGWEPQEDKEEPKSALPFYNDYADEDYDY